MLKNTILNRGEFSALQQLFVRTSFLLRHSYCLARGFLFFLAGISFLVLTACAGGGGGGSSSGGSASAFEVKLTFAPIPGGFVIANQSDFGSFVSLNITATSGGRSVERIIATAQFIDDRYHFLGLNEQSNYTFQIIGTLDDGGPQEVEIVFVWEENEEDHNNGGIRPGLDTDGDRRANSVDDDDDNDGIKDTEGDDCSAGDIDWRSNSSSDHDGDGCRDAGEDTDDDNDGVADSSDDCSPGVLNWTSNPSSDNDGDGCLDDSSEDTDDDNDELDDTDPIEQQNNSDNVRCSLLADCDGDTIRDIDEVAASCVIKADCDDDGRRDGDEEAGCVQNTDCDNDGVGDGVEAKGCAKLEDCDMDGEADGTDIDDDGDGLIELATHEELNSVRYALKGNGSRSAENAALDITGCGGDGGIRVCNGYELVADISLATYADDEGGKGWQPLGHDTDSSTNECQGTTFSGTFDGNGWTISDLNISRSGENCVGLFGHVAADTTIRNLSLSAETVMGRIRVGGLVGSGDSARIVSSSIVVEEIIGGAFVGGLMGQGQEARIVSSSVVVGQVSGTTDGGGLIGSGQGVRIDYSSVMAGEVSGETGIGGLVGDGRNGAQIISSSVVVGEVKGGSSIGGLVGDGANDARIISSSVVVGEVRGTGRNIGGLVGNSANDARIISSSVVVGEVSGPSAIGVLTGNFNSGKIAYSYVVSGSDTPALTGIGSGEGVASYWDSDTSGVTSGNHGEAQTSDELRTPEGYDGIYASWDEDMDIFGNEDEPLAVWCDKDHSGSIEAGEKTDDNRIWDFGTNMEYPAIRCTPIGPTEWRDWWSLDGNGEPELNQMLLDNTLNPR